MIKRYTEAEFQRQVLDLAKLCGFLRCHFRPAMNRRGKWATAIEGDAGFPDTVIVHPIRGRLIFAELKVHPNKATPDQLRWIEALQAAGQYARVWYPDDWPEIEAILMDGMR